MTITRHNLGRPDIPIVADARRRIEAGTVDTPANLDAALDVMICRELLSQMTAALPASDAEAMCSTDTE